MNVPDALAFIRGQLRKQGTEERRKVAQWYFKETVDTYGVAAPAVRAIIRELAPHVRRWPVADRNRLCTGLMKTKNLEEGTAVVYLYEKFQRHCGEPEFRLFERWVDRYVTNWAVCDGVGTKLIAACIANQPTLAPELVAWTASKNRWKRRAAAVSMVREAARGRHTDLILDIAARMILDPDDMVQKGTGWMLKEAYAAHPKEVVRFLEIWKSQAPRLTLRYAAEKMSAADKAAVMQRHVKITTQ